MNGKKMNKNRMHPVCHWGKVSEANKKPMNEIEKRRNNGAEVDSIEVAVTLKFKWCNRKIEYSSLENDSSGSHGACYVFYIHKCMQSPPVSHRHSHQMCVCCVNLLPEPIRTQKKKCSMDINTNIYMLNSFSSLIELRKRMTKCEWTNEAVEAAAMRWCCFVI